MAERACRFCAAPLEHTFLDLGMSPVANAYLEASQLDRKEPFYPLHAYVCGRCFLVQLEQFHTPAEIFGDYAYFSSYSDTWLEHARTYVSMARERFGLGRGSLVVEVASNDGYLLQYFRDVGVPVLGVEPARNVAAVAEAKGIPTVCEFFGREVAANLAAQGRQADLLIGNNVLAHVPDLNDFVAGLKIALKPRGTITLEFPHLLELIEHVEFDTIYHEHFSYFSLMTAEKVMSAHGLSVFDVETLPTHGGSLRLYVSHADPRMRQATPRLEALRERERRAGLDSMRGYADFEGKVRALKRDLVDFLISAQRAGKSVAGYGAPAKGNTLLNYCGIGPDLVAYTVDRNPHKQGRYLPGSRIPVMAPARILETRPDYVLILPWNIKDEIVAGMAQIRSWGGKFVVPVPSLAVL